MLPSTPVPGSRRRCAQYGWASRVRWDKGTENIFAAEEQVLRMGSNRGSALTGRSTKNCRAEYIWNYVSQHVSGYFREPLLVSRERTPLAG